MERPPRQNLNNINTGSSSQGGDMSPSQLERAARFFEIATRFYGKAEGAKNINSIKSSLDSCHILSFSPLYHSLHKNTIFAKVCSGFYLLENHPKTDIFILAKI